MSGTAALGIFFSRKSKNIKKFTSKTNTVIFLSLLSIIVFFLELSAGRSIAWSIGHTIGYVWLFSYPAAALGVLFMNKFKFKEKEIWPAWFFSLLLILIIFIRQYIFGK